MIVTGMSAGVNDMFLPKAVEVACKFGDCGYVLNIIHHTKICLSHDSLVDNCFYCGSKLCWLKKDRIRPPPDHDLWHVSRVALG